MKRILWIIVLLNLFVLSGCIRTNTSYMDDPKYLYKEDPSIDMIVYKDTAYKNANDIEWVMALDLTLGESLGTISDDCKSSKFADYSATKLEIGTTFYQSFEHTDIIIVKVGDTYYRYLAVIEG